jgi:hypothetical protein
VLIVQSHGSGARARAAAASVFCSRSWPVLAVILFLTAVVPYGVLNQYSLGSAHSPGLFSDIFLLAGLAGRRLPGRGRRSTVAASVLARDVRLLVLRGRAVLAQSGGGYSRSTSVRNARVIFALRSFLIALP